MLILSFVFLKFTNSLHSPNDFYIFSLLQEFLVNELLLICLSILKETTRCSLVSITLFGVVFRPLGKGQQW